MEKFDKRNFDTTHIKETMGLSGKYVFTLVTRLLWEKGIREAIEALQIVAKKHPNIVFLIVGDEDGHNPRSVTQDYIKNFETNENIRFVGKKSNINEILAATDVYLYPSYYREGIPRSVLEALATGIPIVTTNMPGCNLTVIEKQNGLLIEPKSKEAIVEAVNWMIENKENWASMGLKSRELAQKEFSDTMIYSQIESIYASLYA